MAKKTTQERAQIVQDQAEIMLSLIDTHKDNSNLKDIIQNHIFPDKRNLKPDAINLVIDYLKHNQYPSHIIKIAQEVLIERRMGKVKYDINFEEVGKKEEGQASGRLVKKPHKPSHIMQKDAPKFNYFDDHTFKEQWSTHHPSVALEYLGSQLGNLMMQDASPKVKLHKNSKTQEVTILSTYLDKFTPIATPGTNENGKATATLHPAWEDFQKNPKGFGKFFAANFILADNDLSGSNVDTSLRRIDFGQSLNFLDCETTEKLKDHMLKFSPIYKEEMFHGIDFASEILESSNNIDLDQVRHTIKVSLKNISEAYGDTFFNDVDLKHEMKVRLGIPPSIKLTPELIEETIVTNIEKQKASLHKMAHMEVKTQLKQAIKSKDVQTIKKLNDLMPKEVSEYINESKPIIEHFELKLTDKKIYLISSTGVKLNKENAIREADRLIDSLKKNYGDNYLKNPNSDICRALREFTGIGLDVKLTEEIVRDKFITRIEVSQHTTIEQKVATASKRETLPIEKAIDENSLKQILSLPEEERKKEINGMSPLKYAIKHKKYKLMGEMCKLGFKLKEDEKKTQRTITQSREILIKSNTRATLGFKSLTKSDLKRLEVIGTMHANALKEKEIDLSKKPSPLYIAIETGQLKLASEMIEHGLTLKQSEINKYIKDKQIKKQGIISKLGFKKRKRSDELVRTKIETLNASLKPNVPRIKPPRSASRVY